MTIVVEQINPANEYALREWCRMGAAVDPESGESECVFLLAIEGGRRTVGAALVRIAGASEAADAQIFVPSGGSAEIARELLERETGTLLRGHGRSTTRES